MHPILGQPRRLAAYVLEWIPLAGMLVYLLAVPGGLKWTEAFVLGVPLGFLYAFMCLSAWYSCRGAPLDGTGPLQLVLTHSLGALLVSTKPNARKMAVTTTTTACSDRPQKRSQGFIIGFALIRSCPSAQPQR